jgi:hypothetical protein
MEGLGISFCHVFMNSGVENQHYISRFLLKRFRRPGEPLQCYQIASGAWIPKSVERACSAPGYNQLILPKGVENTLEDEFSKVESGLPKLFRVLESAAGSPSIALAEADFATLCRYCAILKASSPFSKATAVVNFVFQLNLELEQGRVDFLRELQISELGIHKLQQEVARGRKIVIESDNPMQMLYRRNFRHFPVDVAAFGSSQWRLLKSPLEMPISDVGLYPLHLEDHRANRFVLPISPHLILQGTFYYDPAKNKPRRPIESATLSEEDAQGYFDFLCASGITELICARKVDGIRKAIERCAENGITFQRLSRTDDIRSAGEKISSQFFQIRVVDVAEYKAFIHARFEPRREQTVEPNYAKNPQASR